MAGSVQGRSLEEHVTCHVCKDLLSNPRALPCMHTFCAHCLSSYIASVCTSGDEKWFKCPVCKTITKPSFKGLHQYAWADNFPLNYALQGLADEMKCTQKRDVEMNSVDMFSADYTSKQSVCRSHTDRVIEFECVDHCETFCSICAALYHRKCATVNFLERREKQTKKADLQQQNSDDNSQGIKKKHKAVTRLSRGASADDKANEDTNSKYVDKNILAHDFELALSIDGNIAVLPTEIHEYPLVNIRKPLSRQCSNHSEDDIRHDDRVHTHPEGHHNGATYNSTRNPLLEATHAKVDTHECGAHHMSLNSLNDILEEDEDIISVTIDQNVSKSHLALKSEIYIRTQYDQKCCSVTGMCAMPDGRVLLADEANGNIKLFDSNGIYEAHLMLESEPWDVTAIDQYEAAVSCPSTKCIHVMLVNDTLTITRSIDLGKRCYGLVYYNGEIYIAMDNEVRILTYEGKVVCKITSEYTRKKLFALPLTISKSLFRSARYISINTHDPNVIVVVSDAAKVCVTSMSKRGQIVSRLRLGEDGVPRGVSVGRKGEFYVCQAPNKLILISSDEHGNRINPVLELDSIQSVHYQKLSKSLWVSRKAHSFVMVYNT